MILLYERRNILEEKLLILISSEKGHKSQILHWSEVKEKFNFTNEELTKVINEGLLVDNMWFIDEALTRN